MLKIILLTSVSDQTAITVTLNFPLEQYIPELYEQLALLGLSQDFDLNLHEILVSLRALNGAKVEERIGPYIADVYCPTEVGNGLAIEVCVSHEMEEEKRSFYSSKGISFLELIPKKVRRRDMNLR